MNAKRNTSNSMIKRALSKVCSKSDSLADKRLVIIPQPLEAKLESMPAGTNWRYKTGEHVSLITRNCSKRLSFK